MAAWLRQRGEQVKRQAASAASSSRAGPPPDDELWTQAHEKELDFVKRKRLKRAAEEVRAGRRDVLQILDVHELRGVLKHLQTMKKTDGTYLAEKQRMRAAVPAAPPDLSNACVYLEDPALRTRADVQARCNHLQVTVTSLQAPGLGFG